MTSFVTTTQIFDPFLTVFTARPQQAKSQNWSQSGQNEFSKIIAA